MPTYALGGFTTLSQKFLSSRIASQSYAKSALLYALAGYSGTNDLLSIGRPSEALAFSGASITKARQQELTGRLSYAPRIQGYKVANTKVTGANDTMPSVNSPTTNSNSQAIQYAANFNYMWIMQSAIEVRQIDLDFASQGGDGDGLKTGAVVEAATQVAMQDHVDQLASRLLYGSPTNQFAIPCDDLQGVITAGTALNTYGSVDRSNLPTGDPWNPINVSTAKPLDIYQLIQDMNITQKMNVYGRGVNLILCGGANYIVFKNQILARSKDAGYLGGTSDGLPEMAKMGVKKEVMLADNTWVMHEPFLDTCYGLQYGTTTPLYTAQPSYIIGLNLDLWSIGFQKSYKMQVTPYVELFDKARNAPLVNQSFIRTAAMIACDRPSLGVALYTNVS